MLSPPQRCHALLRDAIVRHGRFHVCGGAHTALVSSHIQSLVRRRHASSSANTRRERRVFHDTLGICHTGSVLVDRAANADPSYLIERIEPLPSLGREGTEPLLLLLLTPSFAPALLESEAGAPKLLTQAAARVLSNAMHHPAVRDFRAIAAVVDRLPAPSQGSDGVIGREGIAYAVMDTDHVARDWLTASSTQDEVGTLAFRLWQLRMQQPHKIRYKTMHQIKLPLANTIFQTGQGSTMYHVLYDISRGTLQPVEAKQVTHQVLTWPVRGIYGGSPKGSPVVENNLGELQVNLVPLTVPRRIETGMGNIIRQISNSEGNPEPASPELERAVSAYFNATGQAPHAMPVWAVVSSQPAAAQFSRAISDELNRLSLRNKQSQPKDVIQLAERINETWTVDPATFRPAIWKHLHQCGARIHRVLSGGGGWGKKAGLLSLDPNTDVQKSAKDAPPSYSISEDFSTPLPVVAEPGDFIQFFACPAVSLSTPKHDLSRQTALFGTIPSSIDDIPEITSDEPATVKFFPGLFGALSENGMSIRSIREDGQNKRKILGTIVDVPFSLFIAKSRPRGSRTESTMGGSDGAPKASPMFDGDMPAASRVGSSVVNTRRYFHTQMEDRSSSSRFPSRGRNEVIDSTEKSSGHRNRQSTRGSSMDPFKRLTKSWNEDLGGDSWRDPFEHWDEDAGGYSSKDPFKRPNRYPNNKSEERGLKKNIPLSRRSNKNTNEDAGRDSSRDPLKHPSKTPDGSAGNGVPRLHNSLHWTLNTYHPDFDAISHGRFREQLRLLHKGYELWSYLTAWCENELANTPITNKNGKKKKKGPVAVRWATLNAKVEALKRYPAALHEAHVRELELFADRLEYSVARTTAEVVGLCGDYFLKKRVEAKGGPFMKGKDRTRLASLVRNSPPPAPFLSPFPAEELIANFEKIAHEVDVRVTNWRNKLRPKLRRWHRQQRQIAARAKEERQLQKLAGGLGEALRTSAPEDEREGLVRRTWTDRLDKGRRFDQQKNGPLDTNPKFQRRLFSTARVLRASLPELSQTTSSKDHGSSSFGDTAPPASNTGAEAPPLLATLSPEQQQDQDNSSSVPVASNNTSRAASPSDLSPPSSKPKGPPTQPPSLGRDTAFAQHYARLAQTVPLTPSRLHAELTYLSAAVTLASLELARDTQKAFAIHPSTLPYPRPVTIETVQQRRAWLLPQTTVDEVLQDAFLLAVAPPACDEGDVVSVLEREIHRVRRRAWMVANEVREGAMLVRARLTGVRRVGSVPPVERTARDRELFAVRRTVLRRAWAQWLDERAEEEVGEFEQQQWREVLRELRRELKFLRQEEMRYVEGLWDNVLKELRSVTDAVINVAKHILPDPEEAHEWRLKDGKKTVERRRMRMHRVLMEVEPRVRRVRVTQNHGGVRKERKVRARLDPRMERAIAKTWSLAGDLEALLQAGSSGKKGD